MTLQRFPSLQIFALNNIIEQDLRVVGLGAIQQPGIDRDDRKRPVGVTLIANATFQCPLLTR